MPRRRATTKTDTLEARVTAFRSLVLKAVAAGTGKKLKPYEGAVSLRWPPLFEANGFYSLHLSCSALGGETNHFAWSGRTWAGVFRKATADVEHWLSQNKRGRTVNQAEKEAITGYLRIPGDNLDAAIERAQRMGCRVLYSRREQGASIVGVELPDQRAIESVTHAALFEETLFERDQPC